MPIDIKCEHCGGKFRVADKFAGKKAKCAKCGGVIAIPAAEQAPTPEPAPETPVTEQPATGAKTPTASPTETPASTPAAETEAADKPEWYMQTDDGEEYGPVTKKDLDSWVADGRIDSSCQVLKDGWDQWKWAEDVFANLGGAAAGSPFEDIGQSTSATGEVNPFQSPTQVANDVPATAADGGAITSTIVQALAQTRPWVLFLSIVGFILSGLMVLVGLGMGVTSLSSGQIVFIIMAAMYVAMALLYLAASYYLFTYAKRIQAFLRGKSTRDLEIAIVAQKSFWKLVGIVTAVVLVLYLLMFAVLFAVGAMGSAMMR